MVAGAVLATPPIQAGTEDEAETSPSERPIPDRSSPKSLRDVPVPVREKAGPIWSGHRLERWRGRSQSAAATTDLAVQLFYHYPARGNLVHQSVPVSVETVPADWKPGPGGQERERRTTNSLPLPSQVEPSTSICAGIGRDRTSRLETRTGRPGAGEKGDGTVGTTGTFHR